MTNHSILYNANYQGQSIFLWSVDKVLTPFSIAWAGRTTADSKTYHLALRILAGVVALAILPVTLTALAIKWWKRQEWENGHHLKLSGTTNPMTDSNDFVDEPLLVKDEAIKKTRAAIERIQHLDIKLGTPAQGSWRAWGEKNGETNQTFDLFIDAAEKNHADWPDVRPLHVQRVGTFSPVELKIIAITCDFLSAMYSIPVKLQEVSVTMEELKQRFVEKHEKQCEQQLEKAAGDLSEIEKLEKAHQAVRNGIEKIFKESFPREKNKQYDVEFAVMVLRYVVKSDLDVENEEKPQLIAFTGDDLFAQAMQNFVFGYGTHDVGIWSKARLGDPNHSPKAFSTCLIRMMKIATHEFGHMRGIPHCTDYACNMGGGMGVQEMDSRSLLFCAHDTAKISYLTQTSVLEHEQKLLEFFENFNTKYQLQCDFSAEIGKLKARIAKLKQSAA